MRVRMRCLMMLGRRSTGRRLCSTATPGCVGLFRSEKQNHAARSGCATRATCSPIGEHCEFSLGIGEIEGNSIAAGRCVEGSDGDHCVAERPGLVCFAHLRSVSHSGAAERGSCALLIVTARGDALDLGDNRRFPFTIGAREIAEDLVQDLDEHGVFVCAGARPSQEELAAASAKRDDWYQRLVVEGDQMWARGHSYREISDMHRRAALSLGSEREWAYVPTKMLDCPGVRRKGEAGSGRVPALQRDFGRGEGGGTRSEAGKEAAKRHPGAGEEAQ